MNLGAMRFAQSDIWDVTGGMRVESGVSLQTGTEEGERLSCRTCWWRVYPTKIIARTGVRSGKGIRTSHTSRRGERHDGTGSRTVELELRCGIVDSGGFVDLTTLGAQ